MARGWARVGFSPAAWLFSRVLRGLIGSMRDLWHLLGLLCLLSLQQLQVLLSLFTHLFILFKVLPLAL